MPPQPGDMKDTFADTKKINQLYDWKPITKVEEGIAYYAKWYKDFYKVL